MEVPGKTIRHVHRDQPDAVAVMAAEICLDEMIRDDPRLLRPAARGGEDARRKPAQILVIDRDERHETFSVGRNSIAYSAYFPPGPFRK